MQSAPQLVLSATAAPGRREDCAHSWWVGGLEGTPGFPSPPLVFSPSSSCQHSPHERSDASQQRATSNDTQHANNGECLPGEVPLVILELLPRVHGTLEKEGGEAVAASGAIIHSPAHFSPCSDDIFMWYSICPKTVTQCNQK